MIDIPIPSDFFRPNRNAALKRSIPPYHETAVLHALRGRALARKIIGERQSIPQEYFQGGGLSSAAQGLSSVPAGANFGTAFLSAAGGAAKAYQANQALEAQRSFLQAKEDADQAELDRRYGLDQSRITEDERHNRAMEGKGQPAEEDFTLPVTGPEGDEIGRALPPYLEGVPKGLFKTAGTEFFQKKYASDKQDPMAIFLAKEQYKLDHPPGAGDTDWISSYTRTTRSGKRFLDIAELTGKDHAAAVRYAAKEGIPAIGSADASQLQDIDAARGNIAGVLEQVESLLPKDAQGRISAYPEIKLSSLLQTNAQRTAFTTWRGAAIRNFRAVAGSKGLRLNQKEIDLAVKNEIPQITDTYEVAKAKMENVLQMLDNAEGPILNQTWGGPAPSGQAQDPGIVEWVRDANGKLVRK